jgi:hypothetical protein
MSKPKYKPSGAGALLGGIVVLGIAIIIIVYLYGYIAGLSQGGDIVIKQVGLQPIFEVIFLLVVLGFVGGVQVGLYFEAQRAKWLESLSRRRSHYTPPPPPAQET